MSLTPEQIEEGAIALHDKMEHLDPVGSQWESLTEHEREFYRTCAEATLNKMALSAARKEKALRDYVQHLPFCRGAVDCSCGLQQLLETKARAAVEEAGQTEPDPGVNMVRDGGT